MAAVQVSPVAFWDLALTVSFRSCCIPSLIYQWRCTARVSNPRPQLSVVYIL